MYTLAVVLISLLLKDARIKRDGSIVKFNKCNRNVTKYQRVELRQNYDKDNKESSCYNNDSRNNDIDSYDS